MAEEQQQEEKGNGSEMGDDQDATSIAVCDFFAKCFISLSDPPQSLSELSDGVVMFQALSEM